jgi:hypothetical protein
VSLRRLGKTELPAFLGFPVEAKLADCRNVLGGVDQEQFNPFSSGEISKVRSNVLVRDSRRRAAVITMARLFLTTVGGLGTIERNIPVAL